MWRHSSIFLTEDEKEGRGGDDEDEMPDLPEVIESFQEEDMEDAITGKKEEEENIQQKDELWLMIPTSCLSFQLPGEQFIVIFVMLQHDSFSGLTIVWVCGVCQSVCLQ